MILRKGEDGYVEGEAQRSGEDWVVEAVEAGAGSGGCGARAGGVEAHHLGLESQVWGPRCRKWLVLIASQPA
jgi:hypothetical protein